MSNSLRESMIIGMCNPLLDISANADDTFLEKYELLPNNAILADAKHKPLYDELVVKFPVDYIAGGSGQNAMRVAQWVLQKPQVTVFMGCVGKDKYSAILEEKAREDGVNVRYQSTDKEPTGTCAVLITGNGTNRSLCANLAAANCFTKEHIEVPDNKALIEQAIFYYITGFFFTVSPDTIVSIAEHSHANEKTFTMNLSAPFVSQFYKEALMQVYPYIDIIFGNETEAQTFAKEMQLDVNPEDLKAVALKMAALPKKNEKRSRLVVITQGKDPVLVAEDGQVREFPVEKLEPERIVDTNGAGDAFVGGFLAQLVQGKPVEDCVKCGVWAATHIIQRDGCNFDKELKFQQ